MGEANTFLFVGGPQDGQRVALDHDRPFHRFAVLGGPPSCPGEFIQVRTIEYRRVTIAGDGHLFTLYAFEGMTDDDVLRALLTHYPAKEPS